MKQIFRYSADARVTAWKRYKFEIEADDRAQADELMKQIIRDNYDVDALAANELCVEAETLPYSEEQMMLEENGGEATIEVSYEDLENFLTEYIYDNKQYEDD